MRRSALSAALLVGLFSATSAHALSVTPTANPATLANGLLGSGQAITILNVSYSGAPNASGTFSTGPLDLSTGSLFTTGAASNSLPRSAWMLSPAASACRASPPQNCSMNQS